MKKILYAISVILLIIIGLIVLRSSQSNTGDTVSGTTESPAIRVSTRPAANVK